MPFPTQLSLAPRLTAEVSSDHSTQLASPYAAIGPTSIITTVAGNGQKGSSGDGGPATKAKLNQPMGVAADAMGDVYIADSFNDLVREVSKNGTIRTIRGQGAVYGFPVGLAVDPAGPCFTSLSNRTKSSTRSTSPPAR